RGFHRLSARRGIDHGETRMPEGDAAAHDETLAIRTAVRHRTHHSLNGLGFDVVRSKHSCYPAHWITWLSFLLVVLMCSIYETLRSASPALQRTRCVDDVDALHGARRMPRAASARTLRISWVS